MTINSNSVVLIELLDGTKLISDDRVGMNMDERGINGCIVCTGAVEVFHLSGGSTTVSEHDVASFKTILETIDWTKELEWVDRKGSSETVPLIPGDLTFSQIESYYAEGYFLRGSASKTNLKLEEIRAFFRFIKGEELLQPA